jgi:micrococcal nuclease|tara:strand:- start:6055 stop:6480 length:426 start_codon:yes stop_codon:yes gene_type:complete
MYEYDCQVTRVVDGDTVKAIICVGFDILYKSTIRLYAIDTPESRTRNLDEKARGNLAKYFLKDSIDNGKKVVIKTHLKDSRGKFGRVLGTIWVDGVNINQALVENYLAVSYHGQAKSDVENEHLINRQKLIEIGVYVPNET